LKENPLFLCMFCYWSSN